MKLLSYAFTALLPLVSAAGLRHALRIPNSENDGPVSAEFKSKPGGLDGQKVFPRPNSTTFDWWYFDAVSTSSANESISIVFYEAGADSLAIPDVPLLYAVIYGSYSNGTLIHKTIPASEAVTITKNRGGIHGDWKGTGLAFAGSSLEDPEPIYTVTVNSPSFGIRGKLTLRSRAPAHYACSLDKPGQSEEVVPNIGWANAQPDATAAADFVIDGTKLCFTGNGYHDKNWGLTPINVSVQTWYWGHARLGPYSLVWFDTRTPDGKEYHSGYVAQNGNALQASCSTDSVKVRPIGKNNEYPPVPETGVPGGMTMRFDLGKQGSLVANVTTQLVVYDVGFYQRYIGPIVGGIEGGKQYEGKALFEAFKLPL
ncbi:hypothetical protein EDB80DRAFT_822716 [Ilyonectria destructans]|nr:hypothetical protein EDB80DRAFT_822716 [Ilyonectria destructans]